jgi:hypothetical protein
MVRVILLAVLVSLCFSGEAWARRRNTYSYPSVPVGHSNRTAQDVAEACASMGRLQHMGGYGGNCEGLGMGHSPDSAIRSCCYYGQISIMDQGVAQGRNGMWYACIRGR